MGGSRAEAVIENDGLPVNFLMPFDAPVLLRILAGILSLIKVYFFINELYN